MPYPWTLKSPDGPTHRETTKGRVKLTDAERQETINEWNTNYERALAQQPQRELAATDAAMLDPRVIEELVRDGKVSDAGKARLAEVIAKRDKLRTALV